MSRRDPQDPREPEAEALRRENARLRERASVAEYWLQRLEVELREIKQSGALRIGRFISRLLPRGLKHRLYDPFRRTEPLVTIDPPLVPVARPDPRLETLRLSVVVPIYDHARHLPAMLDSLLAQTRSPDEILLVDDASPDPAVGEILARYAGRPGVQILHNETNLGISRSTNRAIRHATGTHLAFVDCDDLLEPHALEKVVAYLAAHPGTDFVYTDRIDIDDDGHELQRWSFADRACGAALPELLRGMFTSHLKVVSASALRDVGLFKPRYDLTQDYDLALRLAERRTLGHLPEAVYRFRIHGKSQSQQQQRRQEEHLERIRQDSLRRKQLRSRTEAPRVSVVLEGPGEVEPSIAQLEGNVNLASSEDVEPEYVLRLQRGVVLSDPGMLAKMIERLEQAPELSACAAMVLEGDRVVSNGGHLLEADRFCAFVRDDHGRQATELANLEERRCDWLPPGATLWRREIHRRFQPDQELIPRLREPELGLRIRAAGLEVGNCPTAGLQWKAPLPVDTPERVLASLRTIFRAHGVLVRDDALFRALGWDPEDLPAAGARITRSG